MVGLSGMFSEQFPILILYVKIFHIFFEEYLPELKDHMQDLPDALWINKWIQTLFLYSFPYGLCIRIWDNVLSEGTKFLIMAALAILSLI